ncbi:MAG: alpha/beta hydrolase family protein [Anaerotignum sp.]
MYLAHLIKEIPWGDNPFPPELQQEILAGKRGRLLVTIYRAGGEGLHPTILLNHGFPGIEKNFDLAQALRRVGFHVVTYHYSGSWGSDGAYSYANDLEDGETLLEFIKTNETYGFDKEKLFVVGHSVGGFVAAHLFAGHKEFKAGVLLTPCDLGGVIALPEDVEAKRLLLEIFEIGAPWLNGTSPETLFAEVSSRQAEYAIVSLAEKMADRPVFCLGAAKDESCPPEAHCLPWVEKLREMGGTVVYETLDTDHSFSDVRLTMIEKAVRFLAEQAEK